MVNDLVIEVGSARYQDVMDRYIRGEQIPIEAVRPAWQNTTVANQIWADEVLFESIRKGNASRPRDRQVRVLLGDPPIDWADVKTREDHFRWLGMRDSYPAALVQVEVLAKRRKALLVWGHMHFQRRQIMSNFDMSDWRMQTIVSLIERASPTKVFTDLAARRGVGKVGPGSGLVGGAESRGHAWHDARRDGCRSPVTASRSRSHDGQRRCSGARYRGEQWLSMPVEEQLDAVLYLGPAARMTEITTPAQACAQPGFLEERLPAHRPDRHTGLRSRSREESVRVGIRPLTAVRDSNVGWARGRRRTCGICPAECRS